MRLFVISMLNKYKDMSTCDATVYISRRHNTQFLAFYNKRATIESNDCNTLLRHTPKLVRYLHLRFT